MDEKEKLLFENVREGRSVKGVDFSKANLEEANLRESNLSGADLTGANLTGANLTGANLTGANLTGAVLAETKLREVGSTRSNIKAAVFSRAIAIKADFKGVDLRGHILEGANFQKARLIGARLEGANLQKADLSGADLRGANFRGADLTEANFSGADLRGAVLGGADLRKTNLTGANLRRVYLGRADLTGVDLTGVDLREANLEGANLSGTNLEGTNLKEGRLQTANLRMANLAGANLEGANLEEASFEEASFERARLSALTYTNSRWTPQQLQDLLKRGAIIDLESAFIDTNGLTLYFSGTLSTISKHLVQLAIDWTLGENVNCVFDIRTEEQGTVITLSGPPEENLFRVAAQLVLLANLPLDPPPLHQLKATSPTKSAPQSIQTADDQALLLQMVGDQQQIIRDQQQVSQGLQQVIKNQEQVIQGQERQQQKLLSSNMWLHQAFNNMERRLVETLQNQLQSMTLELSDEAFERLSNGFAERAAALAKEGVLVKLDEEKKDVLIEIIERGSIPLSAGLVGRIFWDFLSIL